MKEISLTKGFTTVVDDDVYDYVNSFKWYYLNGYAVRDEYDGERNRTHIRMHRLIYELKNGEIEKEMIIDHKDRNGLNNVSDNLRLVTRQQNNTNKSRRKNTSSQYIGVSKHKQNDNWVVEIRQGGKRVYNASFSNEIAGANAYNHHAKLIHGEFVGELNDVPYMSLEEIEKYRCKRGKYKKKIKKLVDKSKN